LDVQDVIVGCETGVNFCDALASTLGLRGNSMAMSAARRNKFMQSEAVRASGGNAAKQALCSTAEDVELFLAAHGDFEKLVVKPNDGAGSEGVAICGSAAEVLAAFTSLSGATNAMGLQNTSVLLMEYLQGREYIVDTVSRDGQHKVVAIWKYDRRVFHGAPVVCCGQHLLPMDAEPVLPEMVEYVTRHVLPSLGITNGAVHTELIVTPRGPVLVEANCRLHGADGGWVPVAEACVGYSQVSALIDAYASADAFRRLPPTHEASCGAMVLIRSPEAGVVSRVKEEQLAKLRSLASFSGMRVAPAAGSTIEVTKDLTSMYGNVLLVSDPQKPRQAFDDDYAAAQAIIDEGIFEVEAVAREERKSLEDISNVKHESRKSLGGRKSRDEYGSTMGVHEKESGWAGWHAPA